MLTNQNFHNTQEIGATIGEIKPALFSISPNPFGEKTLLSILKKDLVFPLDLEISDLQGLIVRRETILSEKHFLLKKSLVGGVYFVKIMDGKGFADFGKLICN
jgi:hypothetical protein